MTSFVTYERGLGGYNFSASELAELETLRSQLQVAIESPATRYEVGLGGDAYRAIRSMIGVEVNGEWVPKTGIDVGVWAWVNGAIKVNAADGFAADFIREYTATQFSLRGLVSPFSPEQPNQLASNNIALRLLIDIVAYGDLPGIEGLGAIDAGAAASDVFAHDDVQEYAPWAGTLLFPFLNQNDNFYNDLLLSDDTVVATIPAIIGAGTETLTIKYATGTYDLIASLQAAELAAGAAGLANWGEALLNLLGPVGAPFPDQSALTAETTQWFNAYYGLAPDTFDVGADSVLNPGWTLIFDEYDYFVGTYGDDTVVASGRLGDLLDASILNGGFGNDTVIGSDNDDLLDGDRDNDQLNGGGGSDYLFGGVGNDIIHGGADDDFLYGNADSDYLLGGDGNDIYVIQTSDGTDTILDTDGQGRILFDGIELTGGDGDNDTDSGTTSYTSRDGRFTYVLTGDELTITETAANQTITVQTFTNGELGIELTEQGDEPDKPLDPSKKPYEESQTAEPPVSPIVLDLDGDGIETTGVFAGAFFDHEGDGFAERTGWVAADDGLLAWDRNGDGNITSGQELFGTQTRLLGGTLATHGYIALAELDSNADGRIDSQDTEFGNLRVWRDGDGNGFSASGELYSLAASGVASINVNGTSNSFIDAAGNEHRLIGEYTRIDGTTGATADVWFDTNETYSIANESQAVSPALARLPDIEGFGKVYSLHQALARDGTGQIQTLVDEFLAEDDPTLRRSAVDQLIVAWAGASNVDRSSRGSRVDARRLVTLERFFGEEFVGLEKNGVPNDTAAQLINSSFQRLSDYVYARLLLQTDYRDILSLIDFVSDPITGVSIPDVSRVVSELQQRLLTNPIAGQLDIGEFGQALGKVDNAAYYALRLAFIYDDTLLQLFDSRTHIQVGTAGTDVLQSMGLGDSSLYGGQGDDYLVGGSDDGILRGQQGNDNLSGGDGKDILEGGDGDDFLDGGADSDLYIYAWSNGKDRIFDANGNNDILYMGLDVLPGDVTLSYSTSGLRIGLRGSEDFLDVLQSRVAGDWDIEEIRFANGVRWDSTYISNVVTKIIGTDADDDLYGAWLSDTIYAGAGNDTVYGENGNDILYGGSGNDILYGDNSESGDDILYGGDGDDLLFGGGGSDQYIFDAGFGRDTVFSGWDSNQNTTIEFGIGISASDLVVTRHESSLRLSIAGTTDSVTIENWFPIENRFPFYFYEYDNNQTIQYVIFSDGTRIDAATLDSALETDGDDLLIGGSLDDTLRGGKGEDQLYGGVGNDYLEGGIELEITTSAAKSISFNWDKSDYLEGGAGSDTYRFNFGSGHERIYDEDWTGSDTDTVEFGAGVFLSNMVVSRVFSNIQIQLGDSDFLLLTSWFDDPAYQLERFIFADGSELTAAELETLIVPAAPSENNDSLFGSSSADTILGLDGMDQLYGFDGDDFLDGGSGDDNLEGGNGGDIYLFGPGAGYDWIYDYDNAYDYENGIGTTDILRIDAAPNDVIVSRDDTSLYVQIAGTPDQIGIDWFYDDATIIERFEFSDGTVWDRAAVESNIAASFGTDSDDVISGTSLNDFLEGFDGNDTVRGESGNDYLAGGPGTDSLDGGDGDDRIVGDIVNFDQLFGPVGGETDELFGGAGNDRLEGGGGDDVYNGGIGDDYFFDIGGSDVYIFGRGSGKDFISEEYSSDDGFDRLVINPDVAPVDLTLWRDVDNLVIDVAGTGDQLTVSGWFSSGTQAKLDRIEFADGTSWDIDYIEANLDFLWRAGITGQLHGIEGTDPIVGTFGSDTLFGGPGNDWILGGAGEDSIYEGASATATTTDIFEGNDGDDRIESYQGDDFLYGGAGDDWLNGGAGNNWFDGGSGNDYLSDSLGGDDTYVFERGYGRDVIIDRHGTNIVLLGDDIAPADLRVYRSYDLYLRVDNDELRLSAFFGTLPYAIKIQFADGTLWDATTLREIATLIPVTAEADEIFATGGDDTINGLGGDDYLEGNAGNDVVDGGPGDDYLSDSAGNDILRGDFGNDSIFAGNGDDLLEGGAGDDYLEGGRGSDVYVVGAGEGTDVIFDLSFSAPGIGSDSDVIRLEATVAPADVVLTRNEDDVFIDVLGTHVTVRNWYKGWAIERFEFSDGTVWDSTVLADRLRYVNGTESSDVLYGYQANDVIESGLGDDYLYGRTGADVLNGGEGNDHIDGGADDDVVSGNSGDDTLYGGAGNDVITGGTGDDFLRGHAGSDEYRFNRGDGNDTVLDYDASNAVDQIAFGDFSATDIVLQRNGDDLLVRFIDDADNLTIQDWYTDRDYQVESLRASDGTTLVNTDVDQLIQAMASFLASSGAATWQDAVAQRPDETQNLVLQYWTVPAMAAA